MDCMYDHRPQYPIKSEIADQCTMCGENIYIGDEYYQFGDIAICDNDECMEDYIKEFRRIGD